MRAVFVVILVVTSFCVNAQQSDLEQITNRSKAFSQALVEGDTIAINNAYTLDGKILPNNTLILEGESLRNYWNKGIRNGMIYHNHVASPIEIKIFGDYAYDFGYYEGESSSNGNRSRWKGKYIIVWQKVNGEWKMYLDMWNKAPMEE